MIRATPHCFMLLWHRALSALVLALASAGNSIPARIAMMATTTSNSISVNAGRLFRHETEDIMSLIPFSGLWWLAGLLTISLEKGKCAFGRTPGHKFERQQEKETFACRNRFFRHRLRRSNETPAPTVFFWFHRSIPLRDASRCGGGI